METRELSLSVSTPVGDLRSPVTHRQHVAVVALAHGVVTFAASTHSHTGVPMPLSYPDKNHPNSR